MHIENCNFLLNVSLTYKIFYIVNTYSLFWYQTDSQSLVIPENFLEPGVEYMLMLNASYLDQDGSAEVYAKFSTNFPPYNGFCNYTVETGKC